jgi:chemotaxis signal transduction protein
VIVASAEIEPRMSSLLAWVGDECCAIQTGCVTRILPMQAITPLPRSNACMPGVIAAGDKIVPVLDLCALLGFPAAPAGDLEAGCFILVTEREETYALRAGHVTRIVPDGWLNSNGSRDARITTIDMADLLMRIPPLQVHDPVVWAQIDAPLNQLAHHEPVPAMPRTTSLVLQTAHSQVLLDFRDIIGLEEKLDIAAVPDPILSGIAFHGGETWPVVELDALLGHTPAPGQVAQGNSPGAYVMTETGGRRCALSVARVTELVRDADPAKILNLRELLDNRLPDLEPSKGRQEQNAPAAVQTAPLFLLATVGERTFAFPAAAIVHLHDSCPVVKSPHDGQFVPTGLAAVAGRVLPVADLAAIFDLPPRSKDRTFVELQAVPGWNFVVVADRCLTMTPILPEELVDVPRSTSVSAIAWHNGVQIWILTAASIANLAGWRVDGL